MNKQEDFSEYNPFKTKEFNTDIMSHLKHAKHKLTIDIRSGHKENVDLQGQDSRNKYTSSTKTNLIEKTINSLKAKIGDLEKEKQQLEIKVLHAKQESKLEVENLKLQLSKFIEKEFEENLNENKSSNDCRLENTQLKQKIKRGQFEVQLLEDKLKQGEEKYKCLERRYKCLEVDMEQVNKQKQKHIELNILDKMKFEEETKYLMQEKEKRSNAIKKLEQENINLKREIHSIFNKDRIEKQGSNGEKKCKEEYEFEMKEIAQKYNIKIKSQEREIALLKKTIQKYKEQNNESDVLKLAEYERQIDQQKQKLIERDKKIVIQNIEIEKLNSSVENLTKAVKERQHQIKRLNENVTRKEAHEKDLQNKLAKQGLPIKQFTNEFNLKATVGKRSNSVIKDNMPRFFESSFDQEPVVEQQIKRQTVNPQPKATCKTERNKSEDTVEEIVSQERALATLRTNYKKMDSREMSLNEIMLEIRRKADKINDLRAKKTLDVQ